MHCARANTGFYLLRRSLSYRGDGRRIRPAGKQFNEFLQLRRLPYFAGVVAGTVRRPPLRVKARYGGLSALVFVLLLVASPVVHAAAITSNQTGNWDAGSTWVGGVVPTSADTVTIASGHTVTVPSSVIADAASLTVTGAVVNNGTLTVSGTISGAGSITQGVNSILNAGGATTNAMAVTTLTATASPNTVNYNGAAQTVKAVIYHHLSLSTSGIKTLTGVGTINGDLTLSGTATATTAAAFAITGNLNIGAGTTFTSGAFNLTVTGATSIDGTMTTSSATGTKTYGNITINSGGTWTSSVAEAFTINGSFINNSANALTASTGVYTFAGATKTIGGSNAAIIPSITVTGTYTNSGTLTVATALTVTSPGVLTNDATITATASLAGTGTLTQGTNSNLTIGNAVTITTLNAGATGNTVTYDRANTQTVKSATYNHLTLATSSAKTAGGALTVKGTLTLSGTATFAYGAFTHRFEGSWVIDTTAVAPITATAGSTIHFDTPSIPAATSIGGTTTATLPFVAANFNNTSGVTANENMSITTGTMSVTNGGMLTLPSTTVISGAGTFSVASGGTLQIASTAGITSAGATGNVQTTTRTFNTAGNYVYNGTSAQATGSGLPATVNHLTINNASGVTLTSTVSVNGTLTFTSGVLTTGGSNIAISSTGSLSRTSGYVLGNLRKNVATGATSRTFEIGDASNYMPVTVSFGNVTSAADLTVLTTAGDHPNIATSGLDNTKSVNRYWTLTDSGIGFTNYSVTFTFAAGDIDGGASTSNFVLGKWNGAAWSLAATGSRTGTTIQGTGLTSFSDFQVGEAVAGGSVSFAGNPQTSSAPSTWTVGFTSSGAGALAAADTITVVFNSGFTVPAFPTISLTGGFSFCSASGSGSGTTVTITLANNGGTCALAGVSAGTLTIAGITNPVAGSYAANTFSVATSKDTTAVNPSAAITISSAISTQTGNWNAGSTWVGGVVPTSVDPVTIASGHTVTVPSGYTAVAAGLTVTGAVLNDGTLTVSGTISGAGSITQGTSATLNAGGATTNAMAVTTLTATASPNTVNYNGADQTVKAVTYHHLILASSGTKTLTGLATINGDLTLSGTATATTAAAFAITGNLNIGAGTTFTSGAFNLTVTSATSIDGTMTTSSATGTKTYGDITINSGGTWTSSVAEAFTINGSFTNNSANALAASTGVYTFAGATKTIGGANSVIIPSITVTGTYASSGTLTVATLLTVTSPGVLTNGGTITATVSLAGTGTLTQDVNSTLTLAGTSTITTLTATASGNTVNYNGAAQTIKSTTYNNLTLSTSGIKTAGGALTVKGTMTLSGTATLTYGAFTHRFEGSWVLDTSAATPITATAGSTIHFDTPSTPAATAIGGTTSAVIAFVAVNFNNTSGVTANENMSITTGTMAVTSGATLVLPASTVVSGAGTFNVASGGTLQIASTAGITSAGATGNVQTTTRTFDTAGNYVYNGTSAQATGNGLPATVNHLTINNSAGVTLSSTVSVNGTLTFTNGVLTTGGNNIGISATGSVSRTSGHVVGNLRKNVATGATSRTFEIGDASNYTPVTVSFGNVTVAADLTLQTTAGDHPNIATSGLDTTKSVNRYWTLTDGGVGFDSYSATFTFVAGDIDGGAATGSFIVGKWNGSSWSLPVVGTKTGTTTQATGLTSFGDFQVAEGAAYGNVSFSGNPQTSSAPSTWTIGFSTSGSGALAAGDTITVVFNAGFTVPGSPAIGLTGGFSLCSASGSGSGTTVTITLANNGGSCALPNSSAGTLTIAGLTNPPTATYAANTFSFATSKDTTAVNPGAAITISSAISTQTGNWNAGSTWVGGVVPTSVDAVTIASGHTVTVPSGYTAQAASLTVTGAVSNDGTLTVSGTISGAGSITQGTGATLNAGGATTNAMAVTTLTATASPNTVNYNGADQTVKAVTYHHLILAASGTKTLTGAGAINGDLTLSGTATATTAAAFAITGNLNIGAGTMFTSGAFNLTVTGATSIDGTMTTSSATGTKTYGDITINSGGTWTSSVAEAFTINGSFTNNSANALTASTGVYTFAGATKTIGGANAVIIPSITVTGTYTSSGTLTVATLLTVTSPGMLTNGGTITATASLAGTGTLTQNASSTLVIGTAITITTLTATASGNTVNYNGAAQTIKAGTYQHLTLTTSGIKTAGGALTVKGTMTLSGTATLTYGAFTHRFEGSWVLDTSAATPITATAGSTIHFDTPSTPAATSIGGTTSAVIAFVAANFNNTSGVTANENMSITTGTMAVTSGATLVLPASTVVSGAGTFNVASGGTLQIASTAGITSAGATGNVQTTTRTFDTAGNYVYNGTSAQATGSGLPATVNHLTINNSTGVTLTSTVSVNGTLTFTSGVLTTGGNNIGISATGSVSRTSGHVVGNLRKNVATGATSRTFEIGDASNYTPVTVSFGNVTVAADLTIQSTSGDHPNIATSGLNATKSVNRYWTLTDSGIGFDSYSATFTFVAGDIDGGAATGSFIVGKWNGSSWSLPVVGTKTGTTTQATGLTAFGDFQIGEGSAYGNICELGNADGGDAADGDFSGSVDQWRHDHGDGKPGRHRNVDPGRQLDIEHRYCDNDYDPDGDRQRQYSDLQRRRPDHQVDNLQSSDAVHLRHQNGGRRAGRQGNDDVERDGDVDLRRIHAPV